MGDTIDDGADEVKVFRKNDADEIGNDNQATDQLNEDKQDVAFEAEMETQTPINGQKPLLGFPFPLSSPMAWMTSPYQSPSFAAIISSPQYLMMNMMNMNMKLQMINAQNQQQHQQQQQQHFSLNHSMDSRPTTSNYPGGPMMTPKRKRELKESRLKEKDHIKKPLNAFMWFMKENRQKILAEDGNSSKQSAELNTLLGKMWHELPKDEQQKYYEKAKEERENHAKLYPNWSARENYAVHKKKRKKREKSVENMESKKCRARFGMKNTDLWCKHCKRKKRCLLVRDSESPTQHQNHIKNELHNPLTPNMISSPLSGFGSTSRPSTAATTSEEDDIKDIKDVKNILPHQQQQHSQSQNGLMKPSPMHPSTQSSFIPPMQTMMNFAAMSPSFPMFNFNMPNFSNPSFPIMPSSSFNPNVTASPLTPTLQTLN